MTFSLRPYQIEALDIINNDLKKSNDPVLLQAIMGAGKTVIMSRLINKYYQTSEKSFLILMHKQELCEQFKKTFITKTDVKENDIGIYCASLNRKEIKRVTIASIQSFINITDDYTGCDLLVIDECHKIVFGKDSQYEKVINGLRIKKPNMRVIGITATPFRLDSGYIYGNKCKDPSLNLFQKVNYKIKYKDIYKQGYLMPLKGKIAKNEKIETDLENVATHGDYDLNQLGMLMSREYHLSSAKEAIDKYCNDYKKICVFACTIEHAEKLHSIIDKSTIVHSQLTDLERYTNMQSWISGKTRIMISINILIEGFDFPELDCIVMVRPTLSPVLYLQAVGRVLRIAEGKTEAFLLDLTDNTDRFGTDLDNIKIKIPRNSKDSKKDSLEKECPECNAIMHPSRMECPECGHVFPMTEIQEATLPENFNDVMFGSTQNAVEKKKVERMEYFKHSKPGKIPSMRVEYHSDGYFKSYIAAEWICFDHEGYAKKKAEAWWKKFSNTEIPNSVDEALSRYNCLSIPEYIEIQKDGKYTKVINHLFDEVPF